MRKWKGTHLWIPIIALIGASLLASLLWPGTALALQVPNTPTNTPEPPPTPTHTSAPPPTPTHTSAPLPTPTSTSGPPPTPTRTTAPPTPSHTPVSLAPTDTRQPPSAPDPACQSSIEGIVLDRANEPAAGASVTLVGDGWSSGIMTDAAGRYGFAELCSGSATLQALLSNGQSSPMVNVDLTGGNQVQVDLSLAPAAAVTRTVTATPRATASAPTPVPGMPATGSSAAGWLLTGAAALGFLLLLIAGVRRVLLSHEGVAQQRQLHGWSTHDIDITLHNGGDRCDVIEY